ncbi:MAG: KH domain-containing protein [Acidobacteriaceae bacterium]
MVDKPGEVVVVASSGERGTNLRLKVHPTDVGKIIGKQGRTARSLRTILGAISVKVGHRYYLDIVEETNQDSEE